MSDSARVRRVGGQGAAGAAESVVERDRGGEREEALAEPDAQAVQGAGAVAFEAEQVFEVQKIDSMRWRIGARCGPRPGSSLRAGPDDRGRRAGDGGGEVAAGVALVADDDQPAGCARSARAVSRQTSRSSRLGEVSASARGVPSSANSACSRKPQKKRLWLAQ